MSKTRHDSKRIRKTFVRQHSRFYCGLACLASVVRYHGGEATQEKLQAASGTTLNGTSMLGLYQAAVSLGFNAGGFEAEPEILKSINEPVILHIITAEGLEHYMVCYGFSRDKFILGDPATGIIYLSNAELEGIWKSRALLRLIPGEGFKEQNADKEKKRQWFFQLIRPDIPVLLLATVLGIIISVLGLATAIFTQKLLDDYIPSGSTGNLAAGLILLTLILMTRAVVVYIRTTFLVRQGMDMNLRFTDGFFGKLLFLPKPFFDSTTTGDMVARLNDTQRIQKVVVTLGSQVVIDLLIVVSSLTYVFYVSVTTGFISLFAIPVFGVIAWLYHRRVLQSNREVMQSHAATESRYIDSLQGIRTIKSSCSEHRFSRLMRSIFGIYMFSQYKLGMIMASLGFWITIGSSVWHIMIISWAVWQVFGGQLQIGQMMAIITLAGSLGASAVNIALAGIQFQEARVAFDRMYEFASIEPEFNPDGGEEMAEQPLRKEFRLSVRELCFRFPGRSLLLDKVTMDARRGCIVAIHGAVGCGKSTLLEILLRFQSTESGQITVNGLDWRMYPTEVWRKMVGWVPQHVTLFNATILENIALCDEPNQEQVINFCKRSGFHAFMMELPRGYATVVSENCSNLSGGQRQLIALARALYREPVLLLLDEATSAMDQRTESFVLSLLQQLRSRMAIILTTHHSRIAAMADVVYGMGK